MFKDRVGRKQNFFQGTAILALGTLLVKVLGAIFKIPLTNKIGEVGIGYFNTAYQLYLPIYTLATAGLPVAVSRLTAKNAASERWKDVREINRIAIPLFLVCGISGMVAMLLCAKPYISLINCANAEAGIYVLAPTILFCCLMSAFRGYYTGLSNMTPNTVSQVLEAICKLFVGLWMADAILTKGLQQYRMHGKVFDAVLQSEEEAISFLTPFAAAGAIFGITLGAFAGMIYLFLYHRICGDRISEIMIASAPAAIGRKILLKEIIKTSIPICLGALVINIGSLADAGLLQNRLTLISVDSLRAIGEIIIPSSVSDSELIAYLYGCYTMAQAIAMLVPTLAQAIGVSAIPNITAVWIIGKKEAIKREMENVLRLSSLIAFPAGFGMLFLAGPIMNVLYPNHTAGAQIAAVALKWLGITAIFMTFSIPINSMLQSIGRADIPVKLLMVGMLIKIISNYSLCSQESLNLQGACIGSFLCYLFITFFGLSALERNSGINLNIVTTFLKPAVCGIFCAILGTAVYNISAIDDTIIRTLISILSAAVGYFLFIFVSGTVSKEDIKQFMRSK